MKRFISMEEMSCYYEPITEEWKEKIRNEEKACLYHYTSTEVLDKILENAAFRASNIFYLNDSSEFKAGIEKIRNDFLDEKRNNANEVVGTYLDEIEKYDGNNWPGIYTISFSTLYDELQQWTMYAKESGVCIELDCNPVPQGDYTRERLLLKQKSTKGEYINASENYNGFGSLVYGKGIEENQYKKDADVIFDSFVHIWDQLEEKPRTKTKPEKIRVWEKKKQEALQYLALRASYHKMRGFYGEGEVRISFFPLKMKNALTGEEEKAEIKYNHMRNGILRPYLDIYFFQGTDDIPRCPIRSIMIGPSGKQQNVFDSVVHRLKYGLVNVWSYSNEKRFEYLQKYIETCVETLSASDKKNNLLINHINYLIAKEWCEICEDIEFEKAERSTTRSNYLKLNGRKIRFSLRTIKENSDEEEMKAQKKAERYVEKFKKNEFLSQHGIWVKKSKIPYIY